MIDDLIALANRLASASPNKPRQADLRRAVSTAYYALFHAMAKNVADTMAGAVKGTDRNKPGRKPIADYSMAMPGRRARRSEIRTSRKRSRIALMPSWYCSRHDTPLTTIRCIA